MKKNMLHRSVNVAFIAVLALTAVVLSSCAKKNIWSTDLAKAMTIAEKKGRNIFLVFSGEDWNDQSKALKTDILNTKDFKKEIAPKYVPTIIEFSQSEYAKTVTDENSTDEQKKEAERLTALYAEKQKILQEYYVDSFPAIYILSSEGYVISTIPYTDAMTSVKDLSAELESRRELMDAVSEDIALVNKSEGTEKVKALDELYENTDKKYRAILNPAVSEIPSLDPANETGLVGKYELINGYADAVEKIVRDNDVSGAVSVLKKLCDSPRITDDQKQEALYTAAFMLARTGSQDYDTMTELLQKAFEYLPKSDMAQEIASTMDSIQRMKETVMKMQEAASAGNDGAVLN